MLILECTRADYWQTAFVVPVLSIVFLLVLTLIALCKLVLSYRDSEPLCKPMVGAISCLITLVILFGVRFPTLRHGIFLPTVTEDEVQYSQGYVTAISDVPFSPRYSISDSLQTYRASIVRVNGEEFYFLCAEGLEIGQEVVISFLPRCDMVLTCQVIKD